MAVDKYIPILLTIVLLVTAEDASNTITHFSCTSLGQMYMKVPNWVTRVAVICETTQSSGSQTAKSISNIQSGNVTITNCKKEQNAILIMYGGSNPPTPVPTVISSKQKSAQATLRCTTTKPGENWTDTVQLSFHGPTLPGVSATETIDKLSMKLLESTTNFPSATEVSLGEEYILIISGEEPYFKKVTSCKASKTNDNFKIDVFHDTVNTLNNDTIKQLNTSKSLLSHDVFLSMTGFRLVGSTTVYLQCSLDICKHQCPTPTTKRKKSSTPSKLRYATMKFEVKDRMLNPSSSGIKGIHSMTGSFALLFTVTVLGYQTI